MKTKHLLSLGLILLLPVIFFSCKKRIYCRATSSNDFPAFPYSPNQRIVFKDSLNNEIVVTMNSEIKNAQEYDMATVDAYGNSTGNDYCAVQAELLTKTGSSTDSLFWDRYAQIRVEYEKFIEGPEQNITNFSISGLYNVYIHGTIDQNGTKIFNNSRKLTTFKTPYKTYQQAFEFLPSDTLRPNWGHFVFDTNGRILSFNTKADTLKYYYLVE
jgi:hypothetical protein